MKKDSFSESSIPKATRQAVDKFGEAEFGALARKVVYRLQRVEASEIFGADFNYKSLWDEYCHETQVGPHDLLESAWDQALRSTLEEVIYQIPRHTAELLSIFAHLELQSDLDVLPAGSVCPDEIREVLCTRLDGMAANRNLEHLRV